MYSLLIAVVLLLSSATTHADVLRYTQKPSEEELQVRPTYNKYPFDVLNAKQDRTDVYAIGRLAIKEWHFLTGLDEICVILERDIDNVITDMGLKGDITLAPAEKVSLQHKNKLSSKPSLLKSVILPERMRWSFGFDPGAQLLLFNVDFGYFIHIENAFGEQSEVKVVFTYNF